MEAPGLLERVPGWVLDKRTMVVTVAQPGGMTAGLDGAGT